MPGERPLEFRSVASKEPQEQPVESSLVVPCINPPTTKRSGMANSRSARRVPCELWRNVQRKLKVLDAARRLEDLAVPAGNRLELLKGDRAGRHSIRVNDQYRITFRWENGNAYEVRVEDYDS